jgi:hypothetical protein
LAEGTAKREGPLLVLLMEEKEEQEMEMLEEEPDAMLIRGTLSVIAFHVTDVNESVPPLVMEMREDEKQLEVEGGDASDTTTVLRETVPDEEMEKREESLLFSMDES